jgi:hypothetical protein
MSSLDPLILKLQRAKLPFNMAWDQPAILSRVQEPFAALDRAVEAFLVALAPPAPAPYQGEAGATAQALRAGQYLQGKERADSLIESIEAVAKGRGAGLYRTDSLHSAVVDYSPSGDKVWWHQQPSGLVAGVLRTEPAVTKALKQRGVLIWEGAATVLRGGDELWRLVYVDWLTAHQDIFKFVIDTTPMGRRCRFCLTVEPPDSEELVPLTLERQHGVTVVNGVVSLTPGWVHTHERCRDHWLRWLGIASRLGSEEAAQAADAAENRKPREQKVSIPQIKLERPIVAQPNANGEARRDQL